MDLLILGAGGHGKVVKEVAEAIGRYERIVFLDDLYGGANPAMTSATVVGKNSDYEKYIEIFSQAFVAIGNPAIRNQWQVRLTTVGYEIPVLVHPDSYISLSVAIDIGTVVMPKAVVQSNVRIGKGCIISAGAIIDHDVVVGDYCHINAGAVVASGSRVPDGKKVDYGEVYRCSPQAVVTDKEIEDKYKSNFGTDISFF